MKYDVFAARSNSHKKDLRNWLDCTEPMLAGSNGANETFPWPTFSD